MPKPTKKTMLTDKRYAYQLNRNKMTNYYYCLGCHKIIVSKDRDYGPDVQPVKNKLKTNSFSRATVNF